MFRKSLFILFFVSFAFSQEVFIAKIEGTIDNGIPPYLERVISEAHEAEAEILVLKINTFGGRVDAAVEIKDLLFNSNLKTIAYIDKRAISAGAFIALSCDKILMVPASLIGAATVVDGTGQKGSEKQISYFRTEMAATAEAKGRNKDIARGMVDEDVEIQGLSDKGKLITLGVEDALKWKIADHKVLSLDEGLQILGYHNAVQNEIAYSWAEEIVRFLTDPIVSSLLMTLGFLGLLFELRSPGWGIGGSIGLTALILFFGSHYIINLAEIWEIVLFFLGIILLGLEIFVIPGFGIAGIAGIVLILASVFLGMVGHWPDIGYEEISSALYSMFASLLMTLLLAVFGFKFFPKTSLWKKLVLNEEEIAKNGYISNPKDYSKMVGQKGLTVSTLRPTGIADFDGKRFDVVSQGDFIESGIQIEVVQVENYRIIVKEINNA